MLEMHKDMNYMHRILHIGKSIEKYIYVQWTTNDNHCFDVGISGQTNDDMDLDEYVADVDEWDQKPHWERDKATSP